MLVVWDDEVRVVDWEMIASFHSFELRSEDHVVEMVKTRNNQRNVKDNLPMSTMIAGGEKERKSGNDGNSSSAHCQEKNDLYEQAIAGRQITAM